MSSKLSRRHLVAGSAAVAAVGVAGSQPVAAQDASKLSRQELQDLYVNFLKEEGYVPNLDSDGDVVFKVEGRSYLIFVDEKDQEFFRLGFINFWKIESEEERTRVYIAASESSANTKVAKVYVVREDTWASIELFVHRPEDFKAVFKRSMSALKASVETFATKMRMGQ